jgi:hypothetical protein
VLAAKAPPGTRVSAGGRESAGRSNVLRPWTRFVARTEETAMTASTHDGKVVSVAGDKLTTTCGEGKQHCHTMAKDAKVTCDGKAGKAEDLKPGSHVRVTTQKDDKTIATAVESGKHIPAPTAGHKA